MTLAEILRAPRLEGIYFMRPKHGNPYTVWQNELRELHCDRLFCPRITIEDLTATDWEFV